VPHISLVFREMWDSTNLDQRYQWVRRCRVERGGIPHLAKNERDMGHPELRGQVRVLHSGGWQTLQIGTRLRMIGHELQGVTEILTGLGYPARLGFQYS
jgi:hypothetical protein